MRIISQDGMIDVPYEKVGLTISCYGRTDGVDGDDKHYRIRAIGLDDKRIDFIAHYSTKEKAQKAMEMLRGAYCGEIYLNHGDYEVSDIELSQEIEKEIREEMSKSHFIEVKTNNTAVECKVFKFPADDEVEVENANT